MNLQAELTLSLTHPTELSYARRKKRIYVIPMATEWNDPSADVILDTIEKGEEWTTEPSRAPSAIVNDIVGMLKSSASSSAASTDRVTAQPSITPASPSPVKQSTAQQSQQTTADLSKIQIDPHELCFK